MQIVTHCFFLLRDYYVQIKDRHDPGVNIRKKASVASINEAGDSSTAGGVGCSETLSRDFRGQNALRKILGPKGHLDWLIIDLNVAKIITV